MATPDVTKQITLPGGGIPRGIVCHLKAVAANDADAFAYTSSGDIGGTTAYYPDNTGLVTMAAITPNVDSALDPLVGFSPSGGCYQLTTVFADRTRIVEFFNVPDVAGPIDVSDYLTTEPSNLYPPAATNAPLGGDLSGTVGAATIVASAVGTTELATGAATTAKVADAAITEPKLRTLLESLTRGQGDQLSPRFHAMFPGAATGRVDVLVGPADSMSRHMWSWASAGTVIEWPQQLARMCRSLGFAATSDWRLAHQAAIGGQSVWYSTTGTVTAGDHGFGADGLVLDAGASWSTTFGGSIEATWDEVPGDAVDVYVTMVAAGGGSLQVLIDDVEVQAAATTTDATPGATLGHRLFYSSGLLDGAEHTLKVVASGGPVKLDGALVHHGTVNASDDVVGVIWWNGALNGSTPQDHLDGGGFQDACTVLADTLAAVIVPNGVACYITDDTGASYNTEVRAALTAARAAVPDVSLVLVHQPEFAGFDLTGSGNLATGTVWDGFKAATEPLAAAIAEDFDAVLVRLAGPLGTSAGVALNAGGVDVFTQSAPLSGNDLTHVNQLGQNIYATEIGRVLFAGRTLSALGAVAGGAGAGDVVGPASATDSRLVTFDGTTGKLVQSEATVATDQIIGTTGGRVQVGDGTAGHGLAAMVSSAFGPGVSVANNTADIQPAAYLGGTAAGLRLGPGGSTPADVTIIRTGSAVATLTGELRTSTAPSTGTALANKTYVDAQVDDLSGVTNAATARTNLGLGAWSTIPVHSATTGAWVGPNSTRTSTTALTAGLGKEVWTAVWLDAGTYDRIAVYVTTGATSTWRLGLDAISSNGVPTGSALLDAGTVNMSGAAGQRAITISHSITTAGWYWARVKVEAYTANPTVVALSGTTSPDVAPPILGWPTQEASYLRGYPGLYYNGSGAGGALTSSPSLTNNSATGLAYAEVIPVVWFRRA